MFHPIFNRYNTEPRKRIDEQIQSHDETSQQSDRLIESFLFVQEEKLINELASRFERAEVALSNQAIRLPVKFRHGLNLSSDPAFGASYYTVKYGLEHTFRLELQHRQEKSASSKVQF